MPAGHVLCYTFVVSGMNAAHNPWTECIRNATGAIAAARPMCAASQCWKVLRRQRDHTSAGYDDYDHGRPFGRYHPSLKRDMRNCKKNQRLILSTEARTSSARRCRPTELCPIEP